MNTLAQINAQIATITAINADLRDGLQYADGLAYYQDNQRIISNNLELNRLVRIRDAIVGFHTVITKKESLENEIDMVKQAMASNRRTMSYSFAPDRRSNDKLQVRLLKLEQELCSL